MYLNNLTTNKVYDLKVQAGTRSQVGERLMHFGPFSQVQRYKDNSRGVVYKGSLFQFGRVVEILNINMAKTFRPALKSAETISFSKSKYFSIKY